MIRLKTLLLLAASLVLVSCGGQQAPPEGPSPTPEASPTAEASPEAEVSPEAEASPAEGEMTAIPVAIFVLIDANQDGAVTEEEYVGYYTEKAEPKLTKEEAQKQFEGLKPEEGKITKDKAQ